MYEVIDLDHQGRGIIKIDNKIVFVENALKGELIDVIIYEEHKNYSLAKIKNIKTPSIYRREAMCEYYDVCGGCNIMHTTYENQLNYKVEKVKNIFKKYLNLNLDLKIIRSKNELNYRNKITLHGDKTKLGFYQKKSNQLVYIKQCLLATKAINKLLPLKSKEQKVVLRSDKEEVISNILEKSTLIKEINGLKFKININSFFQVNDYICSKLFLHIQKFINKNDVMLDLYSGVGTLSIVTSLIAKKVYSVEINKFAYKDILDNSKLNNISNMEVYNLSVEKFVKIFTKDFNFLIVDPPRTGLGKEIINFILKRKPLKIMYISCDPLTLARDLKELLNDYDLKNTTLLDMFPNTYHVETIVLMSRVYK